MGVGMAWWGLRVTLTTLIMKSVVRCHVSLQFPPARNLDLDFLDNSRTVGDCGMEKGELRTSLEAGSSLNLTWSLGYPHPGGYRLSLVRPNSDQQSSQLVPSQQGGWETDNGKYAQSHILQLPQETCEDCYLRFERQATNWGPTYIFRSCADIRLVSRLGAGDQCQYRTGCTSDLDCNGPKGQGRCVELDTTVYKDSKCFCSAGWFGDQCDKQARWAGAAAKQYNMEEFTEVKLGSGSLQSSLFWRLSSPEEVEIVYSAPTDSWVGLGWKPIDLPWPACQKFPESVPAPTGRDKKEMDCTDMVIGLARGEEGRVADFYSRDRSTPREDGVWGGEDDLLSSHAWEEDGFTTMRFIRHVEGGVADHALRGELKLVWAFGGWADGKGDDDFYKQDQLKFHGHSRDRIGHVTLDLGGEGLGEAIGFTSLSSVHLAILISVLLFVLMMVLQVVHNFDKDFSWLARKSVGESRQVLT